MISQRAVDASQLFWRQSSHDYNPDRDVMTLASIIQGAIDLTMYDKLDKDSFACPDCAGTGSNGYTGVRAGFCCTCEGTGRSK